MNTFLHPQYRTPKNVSPKSPRRALATATPAGLALDIHESVVVVPPRTATPFDVRTRAWRVESLLTLSREHHAVSHSLRSGPPSPRRPLPVQVRRRLAPLPARGEGNGLMDWGSHTWSQNTDVMMRCIYGSTSADSSPTNARSDEKLTLGRGFSSSRMSTASKSVLLLRGKRTGSKAGKASDTPSSSQLMSGTPSTPQLQGSRSLPELSQGRGNAVVGLAMSSAHFFGEEDGDQLAATDPLGLRKGANMRAAGRVVRMTRFADTQQAGMSGASSGAFDPFDPRIPPGGSIGPGGVILDANGNPVLGADGKPLVAGQGAADGKLAAAAEEAAAIEARIAELKRRQEAGELTAEEMAELERLEGRLSELKQVLASDPRIPPGGSIGPGGVILDANGNPVLGADGKPLVAGQGLAGGSSSPPGKLSKKGTKSSKSKKNLAKGESSRRVGGGAPNPEWQPVAPLSAEEIASRLSGADGWDPAASPVWSQRIAGSDSESLLDTERVTKQRFSQDWGRVCVEMGIGRALRRARKSGDARSEPTESEMAEIISKVEGVLWDHHQARTPRRAPPSLCGSPMLRLQLGLPPAWSP